MLIMTYIGQNIWSLLNNRASFTERLWNGVSTDHVDAGTVPKPSNLVHSIRSKSSYTTNRSVNYNIVIGYVENGVFFESLLIVLQSQERKNLLQQLLSQKMEAHRIQHN